MTAAKIRVAGAWVDSTKAGKVRIGGSWVDFGPPSGGFEALSWPSEPSNANAQDGDQDYVMGVKFRLTTGKPCYGIDWRVPDGLATPTAGVYNASLWKTSDTSRVANINFTPVAGTTRQQILFTVPTASLLPATDYVAAVYTNHYSFRAPSPTSGWHVMSPSGNVDAYEACLTTGGPNSYPNNNFNGWYFVGPLIGT